MSFFILAAVLGVPLSWHKTLGGDTLVQVGFELLVESYKVGISQRRAEWFVRWATEIAEAPTVHVKTFEEGIGRITFCRGRIGVRTPFSGPVYRFLTLHPRDSVRPTLRLSWSSCRIASRALVTMTATSSWKNPESRQGSTRRRVRRVRASAVGSRIWTRTEKLTAGGHPCLPWKSHARLSRGFMNVATSPH